jgi:hypothetical protein
MTGITPMFSDSAKMDSAKPSQMIRVREVSEADPIPPITGKSASEASTTDNEGPRGTPEPEGETPEGATGHICDAWAEFVGLGAQHRRGGSGHQGIRASQSSW